MFDLLLIIQGIASAVCLLIAFRWLECSKRFEMSLRTTAAFLVGFGAASGLANALHGVLLPTASIAVVLGVALGVYHWISRQHDRPAQRVPNQEKRPFGNSEAHP